MHALTLLVVPLLQAAQGSPRADWMLAGSDRQGYVMTATGVPTEPAGATLTLRSTSATGVGFGTITGGVRADTLAGRLVRISADIEARDVSRSVSVWLRADSGSRMLVLDNGMDRGLKGTTGPTHMDVTISVPASATNLVFGLLLSGTGEATARNVRVAARPAVAPDAPLAPEAQRVLDTAFSIVRRASLWRDTVTWSRVELDVRAMAAGAKSVDDVYPAIRALLGRLGDHHSFLMKPQGAQAFRAGGAENAKPQVRVQRAGIGYLSVPGYSGGDRDGTRAYARAMQDSLASIATAGAGTCRWIVDLRANGGGNMWPMLGGLRPFLGDGGLGSFVSPTGSAPPWRARDGVDVQLAPALAPLESAYVAVLTGPRTASSGEAVAISFIGRPRTRSFGLATAGLSTANQSFTLPDGSMILLTVSVEADRTGRRYGGRVDPDEVVPATASGAAGDAQLERAVAWLGEQHCGDSPAAR
jgi:carboxyl-terminal processing protease